MKLQISVSLYELHPISHNESRKGALLKVQFEEGIIGYADCHPWIELGDLPLLSQLSLLKQGISTPLTQRSLHFARIDALARVQNRSVFEGLSIPPSNYLITNLLQLNPRVIEKAISEGFTCFKAKLGRSLKEEIPQLNHLLTIISAHPHIKLRLDFNRQLTSHEFKGFVKEINPILSFIDYVEDPFPFNPKDWEEMQNEFKICLACDHQSHQALMWPQAASVLVVKPAVQDEQSFLVNSNDKRKVTITSYLDHPLGQLAAAYTAGIFKLKAPSRLNECGLFSHFNYHKNAFSDLLINQGPCLIQTLGTGFGFDDLLQTQQWDVLR